MRKWNWHNANNAARPHIAIYDEGDDDREVAVLGPYDEDDAMLIVHAVNAVDDLRDALARCEAVLSQLQDAMPGSGTMQDIMVQGYTGAAIVAARRALANTKKEDK